MPPSSKVYSYTVVFEKMPEGGYNVLVPAIPEICTFGETRQEARDMAEDAIRCFLESALRTGEQIPDDVEPATERLAVTLP
jgi:predicted RNase H-like HicB family nuclease